VCVCVCVCAQAPVVRSVHLSGNGGYFCPFPWKGPGCALVLPWFQRTMPPPLTSGYANDRFVRHFNSRWREDMGHVFLAHNFSRATQFLGDASRLWLFF